MSEILRTVVPAACLGAALLNALICLRMKDEHYALPAMLAALMATVGIVLLLLR